MSPSTASTHRSTHPRNPIAYFLTNRSSLVVSSTLTSASPTPAASITFSANDASHRPSLSRARSNTGSVLSSRAPPKPTIVLTISISCPSKSYLSFATTLSEVICLKLNAACCNKWACAPSILANFQLVRAIRIFTLLQTLRKLETRSCSFPTAPFVRDECAVCNTPSVFAVTPFKSLSCSTSMSRNNFKGGTKRSAFCLAKILNPSSSDVLLNVPPPPLLLREDSPILALSTSFSKLYKLLMEIAKRLHKFPFLPSSANKCVRGGIALSHVDWSDAT
mmetsp:Transcript_2042/g.2572  ORF Transcript_2042/g.2572 Transcript_2042/m.2572 type:complete len:278 (+) Transcript_2042:1097-1930(+)